MLRDLRRVGRQKRSRERDQNKMKWIGRWPIPTSGLLVLLFNLALAPTAWAHQHGQRVVAPTNGGASPSVMMTLMDSSFYNQLVASQNINGYRVNVHNTVTGATNGNLLFTRLIISPKPPTNGDLPDVAPLFYKLDQQGGEMNMRECKVGSAQTVDGSNGLNIDSNYTIPACPQSTANASTLSWNALSDNQTDIVPHGGLWIQAKLFSLSQLSDLDILKTEADWLQFRIGESQVMYLPSLQNIPPVIVTPQDVATPVASH